MGVKKLSDRVILLYQSYKKFLLYVSYIGFIMHTAYKNVKRHTYTGPDALDKVLKVCSDVSS